MKQQYDLHPVKHIVHELFPARIVAGGAYLGTGFKVFITDLTLTIWEEGPDKPVLKYEGVYDSIEGTRKDGLSLSIDDEMYYIVRDDHCGCGSRLRGFHPYPGVPRIPSR